MLAEIKSLGIAPTNYLRIDKENITISGQYALDLSFPPLLQSASGPTSEQEPNLSLNTTDGPIIAEIWIIQDESGDSKRASLELSTINGSIHTKLVRLSLIPVSSYPLKKEGGKREYAKPAWSRKQQ